MFCPLPRVTHLVSVQIYDESGLDAPTVQQIAKRHCDVCVDAEATATIAARVRERRPVITPLSVFVRF